MRFPAVSANVGFARTASAVFASQLEFTLDELDDIKVAVSEAVSNCVMHAYPDGPGWVELRLTIANGTLEIEVDDDGVGIADVESAREPGVTSRPDECMGLGFTFMAEYTDSLEIRSEPGKGTRVVMRKRPASGDRLAEQPTGGQESGPSDEGREGAEGDARS